MSDHLQPADTSPAGNDIELEAAERNRTIPNLGVTQSHASDIEMVVVERNFVTPEPIVPRPKRKNEWTTTHSFFVGMGGFAVDTSQLPDKEKYLPGSRER